MDSVIITLKGNLVKYKGTDKYCYPFIRKMLDITQKWSRNELTIAKKIMKNPCNNVINVLQVYEGDKPFIDYQKVDTLPGLELASSPKKRKEILERYNDDIKQGLINLHKLNIVYLDLKWDNTGYDHFTNQWRIFDFDASGICSKDKLKWVVKPPDFAVYQFVIDCAKNVFKDKQITKKQKEILVKICQKKTLLKFDEAIFFETFKKTLY